MSLTAVRDTVIAYGLWARLVAAKVKRQGASAGSQPHLLILAWLFPPTISGGVYRPLSFARTAAERNWQVSVVAGPAPPQPSTAGRYLVDQLPDVVSVRRMAESQLRPSYRFFPRIDGGLTTALETVRETMAGLVERPSIIIASGPPFHNFAAGWMLSRKFEVPLILDYRDEWTDCPFDFVSRGNGDREWEERCLRHASLVMFTTASFRDQSARSFPAIDPRKYRVVPNGFDPDDLEIVPTKIPISPATLDIAFLGELSSHTPPDAFLDMLQVALSRHKELIGRIRVLFVGKQREDIVARIRSHSLASQVEMHGQVPKPEALRIMRTCSLLLALNPNDLHRYIPGKLFDYVASGTPVLVFGNGGEVARIVSSLGVGYVVPERDPDKLAATLLHLLSGQVPDASPARQTWLAQHDRRRIANLMLDDIEGQIEPTSGREGAAR
jgi:glycosyltransferase involved in cell wall biosynthesis